MALFGSHSGSWGLGGLRLPDFGVTERIGSALNRPTTYQGGSNLIGSQPQPASAAVLPTSTNTPNTLYGPTYSGPQNQLSGGGGGGVPVPTQNTNPVNQNQPDMYGNLRNEISSGWDNYINSLNSQLDSIGGQRTAQEGMVGEQAKQAQGQLDLQRTQGLQQLGTEREQVQQNQVKNLRDLAGNITNAMRAGNIYLGARGASDSSAANQYAHALTKLGTRERSNVMQNSAQILNEIGGRETNLNNIYNTETSRIESEKTSNLNSIAQWYASAVQQIQSQQAQGGLGKSQDLSNLSKDVLNQAISALNSINQEAMGRRQALDQWAINNAQNMSQVRSNLQSVAQFSPEMPSIGNMVGTPQMSGGNMFTPTGYGGSYPDDERSRLFG